MKYSVGIDIGGTNTRIAIIDDNYQIIERVQFSTNTQDVYATLNTIKEKLAKFDYPYVAVGLSAPGPLDLINGVILEAPNLGENWWNFSISAELSNLLNRPVYLDNDANLAALAEAVVGEGKDYNHVQFLTISTGLGSGLVIDKNIYLGAHGFAHEIANICLWRNGPQHGNLFPGGIEAICSGSAITNRAQKANLLVNHAGDVNDLALMKNPIALEIMSDAKEYLANAIAIIYAFIDPDIVILGGSVALKIPNFVSEVELLVKKRVFNCIKPYINIRKSTLNEDSGLIGAAILAFQKQALS
ncbi:MAG: ROK family protein [Erysipelotrichaceae bacterium]